MSAETRGMTLKEYCIRSRRAELLQQWHYAKNDGLTPDAVTCHSRQKVWWIDRLGHEWQQEIYSRTALCRGCPFCAGREVLAGFNDLASTHPAAREAIVACQLCPFSQRHQTLRLFPAITICGVIGRLCAVSHSRSSASL